MMIAMKNGKYVQSDGARHDGRGFGRNATAVRESSVILPSAEVLAARQAEQLAVDTAEINERKNTQMRKMNQAKMKAHLDAMRRTEVAANAVPMGGPNDRISKQDQLIKRELMRQMAGRGDFNSYEQMADTKDFGSSASDFQTYSVRGNPLTSDGSYGAVTDFERIVQGKPFSSPYGDIPTGMQRGMGFHPMQRKVGQTMGSWFSDLTGIDVNLSSQTESLMEKAEDYITANPQEAMKTATQLAQQVGLVPAPPPPPKIIPKALAPIYQKVQAQLTGTVKLPVLGLVQKKYLLMTLGLLVVGGTVLVMRRKR